MAKRGEGYETKVKAKPPVDPAIEELRLKANDAALNGNAALDDFLKGLDRADKKHLLPFGAELRKVAQETEDMNQEAFKEPPAAVKQG